MSFTNRVLPSQTYSIHNFTLQMPQSPVVSSTDEEKSRSSAKNKLPRASAFIEFDPQTIDPLIEHKNMNTGTDGYVSCPSMMGTVAASQTKHLS